MHDAMEKDARAAAVQRAWIGRLARFLPKI
jgi:hypothetical protein